MSKINYKKGFTLIELLVVVAIIGILASVVLASLNSARSKGNDAKVKSQLASIRAAAEIYYSDGNNGYGTPSQGLFNSSSPSCSGGMWDDTSSGMKSLVSLSNYPSDTQGECNSTPVGWAVAATLSAGKAWCVDSNGNSKGSTSAGVPYTTLGDALSGGSDIDCN